VLIASVVIVGVVLLLWYLVAMAWAASVAKHKPELHEGVQRWRYGWRCPKCGNMIAPACNKVNDCGGPLVWVQHETRIKCARCHRYFIAHPMMFRETPRPRRERCRTCGWSGLIKDWKIS
jgi:DNA-directed RNA polymerase subunit RPC12/RpoP